MIKKLRWFQVNGDTGSIQKDIVHKAYPATILDAVEFRVIADKESLIGCNGRRFMMGFIHFKTGDYFKVIVCSCDKDSSSIADTVDLMICDQQW